MIIMKKPNYLSRKEAADYLNIKPQTLAVWASVRRYNLPFLKIGRKVYYLKEHLDEFLRSRTYTATLRHE
jgi:excisionase family DNA binding protein